MKLPKIHVVQTTEDPRMYGARIDGYDGWLYLGSEFETRGEVWNKATDKLIASLKCSRCGAEGEAVLSGWHERYCSFLNVTSKYVPDGFRS